MSVVLPLLVRVFRRSFPSSELLLIDDGSTDGSRSWIQAFAKGKPYIRVMMHTHNVGIAKTYQELYRRARGDVIVLFSLDGEWDPSDPVNLAQTLMIKRYDVVVGVRTHKQYTVWRRVVSSFYNKLTAGLFGVPTRDAGSIKAIRKVVTADIPIISAGVFDEAERIIRASKLGYRIGFVDVHHNAAQKKRRGIRMAHIYQAVVDMLRVFVDIHLSTRL